MKKNEKIKKEEVIKFLNDEIYHLDNYRHESKNDRVDIDKVIENYENVKKMVRETVEIREMSIWKELLRALYFAYKFCLDNNREDFAISEVKGDFSDSCYSRFGDLIHFIPEILNRPPGENEGGLKNGLYTINLVEAAKFFNGNKAIPVLAKKINGTDTIVERSDHRTIEEFPSIVEFLNKDGKYKF